MLNPDNRTEMMWNDKLSCRRGNGDEEEACLLAVEARLGDEVLDALPHRGVGHGAEGVGERRDEDRVQEVHRECQSESNSRK